MQIKLAMQLQSLLAVAEDQVTDHSLPQAIRLYRRILALPGCPAEVHLRLGALYHRIGKFRIAMRHFQIIADRFQDGPVKLAALRKMVKIEPREPSHRLRLAELYRKGGNPRLAFAEYAKAAEQLSGAEAVPPLSNIMERLMEIMPHNTRLANELSRVRSRSAAGSARLPGLAAMKTVVEFQPLKPAARNRPERAPRETTI